MTLTPDDLLRHAPSAFTSDEHRRIAAAFHEGWESIAGGIPAQRANATRRWLAELVLERSKYHTTVESLRNEAVYIAVREALPR
jgi:hypothetical protein